MSNYEETVFATDSGDQIDSQERIHELENQVDLLQNLYVTSTQLMTALAPHDVMEVVKEILLNLVGADGFDVSLREQGDRLTSIIVGEKPIPTDSILIEQWSEYRQYVMREGMPLFINSSDMVAVIPLMVSGHATGVLTIFSLLGHKKAGLSGRDLQLLEMLAAHAATALVLASLYERHSSALAEFIHDVQRS